MKLTSLAIPPKYRLLVIALFLLALAGSSAWGGWKVSRWHADAHYATEISTRDKTISDLRQDVTDRDASITGLKARVDQQSEAITELGRKSDAVAEQQRQAMKKAQEAAKASADRLATVQRKIASGASPDEVLQSYWESSRWPEPK